MKRADDSWEGPPDKRARVDEEATEVATEQGSNEPGPSGEFRPRRPRQIQPHDGFTRCVFLGNVDPDVTAEQVLDVVYGGLVESVRLVAEKHCAFISFLDTMGARTFFENATAFGITINKKRVTTGWGKGQALSAVIANAARQGATRCLFVGNITDEMTEEWFRKDFERFGAIDTVKILPDKKIAFIHFQNIKFAIDALEVLLKNDEFKNAHKVNYAKDRCNRPPPQGFSHLGPNPSIGRPPAPSAYGPGPGQYIQPPPQQPPQFAQPYSQPFPGPNPQYPAQLYNVPQPPFQNAPPAAGGPQFNTDGSQTRTVYLGNIDPDTSYEEVFSVIRGGVVDNVKIVPEKACCFISFISPEGAQVFHQMCEEQQPVIRGRPIKVGWGKSSPLPTEVSLAVQQGATRNVYIGNIDDGLTESKLQADFAEFGTMEKAMVVQEKRCAFVEFASINSAMKAVKTIASRSPYNNYRINYGKDSCARMPRGKLGLFQGGPAPPNASLPNHYASPAGQARPMNFGQPMGYQQQVPPSPGRPPALGYNMGRPYGQPTQDPYQNAGYPQPPQPAASDPNQYNAAAYAAAYAQAYAQYYGYDTTGHPQTTAPAAVPAAAAATQSAPVAPSPYGAIGQPYVATSTGTADAYQQYYAQQAALASNAAATAQQQQQTAQQYAAYFAYQQPHQ